MTTLRQHATHADRGVLRPAVGGEAWERTAVGALFLGTAGVHVGIVSADPTTYDGFADGALLEVVRSGWQEVFMADPRAWGLALAAGEALLGVLLLVGGRAARWGWVGVLTFHVLLLGFGFGFWPYALSAGVLLGVLAARDARRRGVT